MQDDSNDLAATMKILDQRMLQAEEWGISLRVFDVGMRMMVQMIASKKGFGQDDVVAGSYGAEIG